MLPTFLSSILLGLATVSPTSLPAGGLQEATVKLDQAALVRITVRARFASTCTLVDHRRGPFLDARSGDSGECVLEELLDAGEYRLRVDGPEKPPKNAAPMEVLVTEFKERNVPLPRLADSKADTTSLAPTEQRSYVLRVDKGGGVRLRIVGRTAGRVELWRDGEWREEYAFQHSEIAPAGRGRSLHAWRFAGPLEPGAYRLTVYGTKAYTWENGATPNDLWVANGAPELTAVSADLELPWHGFQVFRLPSTDAAVVTSLTGDVKGSVRTSVDAYSANGADAGTFGGCEVGATPAPPLCRILSNQSYFRTGARGIESVVSGPAGARVTLIVASGRLSSTLFASDSTIIGLGGTGSTKTTLVTHSIPATFDEVPMGCELREWPEGRYRSDGKVLARDVLKLDGDHGLDAAFNYNGSSAFVMFEVTSGGRHRIEALGERRGRCSLRNLDDKKSLFETPEKETGCTVSLSLPRGFYALQLTGGIEGIEKLKITPAGATGAPIRGKTSCNIARAPAPYGVNQELVLSHGPTRGGLQGVSVLSENGFDGEPIALSIDPGQTLKIPVNATVPVIIRSIFATPFTCGTPDGAFEAGRGSCALPARNLAWPMELTNRGTMPLVVLATRHVKPPPPAPLDQDRLDPPKIPVLALDTPEGRDFERNASHSFVFDVTKPGLYEVTTEGLLATRCDVRTPVVISLASQDRGGRGRNCLVPVWIGPGRYRLVATTTGPSMGRGLIRLTRREAIDRGTITADGETFFAAPERFLVRQALVVPADAQYRFGTDVLGGSTMCRFDDAAGWPVLTVPSNCAQDLRLRKGEYTWMQLPVTVDSKRRTYIEAVRPAIVYDGKKLRFPQLNETYAAFLGPTGKDEYRFDVPTKLDLAFLLQGDLLGNLYRLDGKQRTPVDMFRAVGSTPAAEEPAPEEVQQVEEESPPQEDTGEGYEGEESYEPQPEPAPYVTPAYVPRAAAWPPAGAFRRELEPGVYALVVQHIRDDKHVQYSLQISTDLLASGIRTTVDVPSIRTLRVGSGGIVQLRTRGTHDVRCRIFKGDRLVTESLGDGDDWNCNVSEPLEPGDYRVAFESETLEQGMTEVSIASPELRALAAGATSLTVDPKHVDTVALTPSTDELVSVELRGDGPFSCAIIDAKGVPLFRSLGSPVCSARLRVPEGGASLRAWTRAVPVRVTAGIRRIPIAPASRIDLAAGRYRTGAGVECLLDSARSVLASCGPEVSIDAGKWVFVASDGSPAPAPVAVPMPLNGSSKGELVLDVPRIDVVRAPTDSVHVVIARSVGQQVETPACSIEGGVRLTRDGECMAVGGVAKDATERIWGLAPSISVEVERFAVPLPSSSRPAMLGRQTFTGTAEALRVAMPSSPWRAESIVPPGTWIALLEGIRVRDACMATHDPLGRCVLTGTGGELLYGGERPTKVELVVVESKAPVTMPFDRLAELDPSVPGRLRLDFAATEFDRVLRITGASDCAVTLDDGSRTHSCELTIGLKTKGFVDVEHDAKPWVAVLSKADTQRESLFGTVGAATGALESGRTVFPAAGVQVRTVTLASEAAIRVRADSGVCAFFENDRLVAVDGGPAGCTIDRLAPKGTHRIAIRPFGARPTSGTLTFVAAPVLPFTEGIGSELWLAPGETRIGRFTMAAEGAIGIGLRMLADAVDCRLVDSKGVVVGSGCQLFAQVTPGTYALELALPPSSPPMRVQPVVLGLGGTREEIPEDYLREFFARIGVKP